MTQRLAYHQETLEYLKAHEPELWRWFSSTACQDEYAKNARLDLLKSCYRFERSGAEDLYALCDEVSVSLGVSAPVTLYQSQGAGAMNMALAYVPNQAHIVFEGAVRTTLTRDELRSALAHELTHFSCWQEADGELLIADQMLSAMAVHPAAQPSHIESARLFRLYTEIQADRGALSACGNQLTAISALIKIETGLSEVDPESYLRQSAEVFGQSEVKAEELTHPESYIRAWALKRWADDGSGAETEIRRIIEGRLDTDRLSLTGQQRLTAITRRLLRQFFDLRWLRTEVLLAHARLFFTDFDPDAPSVDDPRAASVRRSDLERVPSVRVADLEVGRGDDEPRALADELQDTAESVQRYLCYVLLDLATVDRQLEDAPLAAALRLAEEAGLAERFMTLAGEELGLSKRAAARLRKEGTDIMARAARAAEEPA